jgi:hypothetical protein
MDLLKEKRFFKVAQLVKAQNSNKFYLKLTVLSVCAISKFLVEEIKAD